MKRLCRVVQSAFLGCVVVIPLVLASCQANTAPTPVPTPAANGSSWEREARADRVSAIGTLQAARRARLSFGVSGLVRVVTVQMGMEVRRGDLLADLDSTELELEVQEAEEALAVSQALLDQARAGPREQEVAIARAEYQRALAEHELLLAGARPQEIAGAEAQLEAASAHYDRVSSGASQEEIIASRADMERAEVSLRQAQAEYDKYAWQQGFEASPQAVALHQATIDHQAATAQYDGLRSLPHSADLAEARADIVRARAGLELIQAGPMAQEAAVSTNRVAGAQAQLELQEVGARMEDVAVAEARLEQTHTMVERARFALSATRLLAPFDSTVSAVSVSSGERVVAGTPVIELLDTTSWRVETRNLGELAIGRVKPDQQAVVRVLAFRDEELRGHVAAVSPVAVVQQGDTTYTVIVELQPTDLNLRPGMNVEVEIEVE